MTPRTASSLIPFFVFGCDTAGAQSSVQLYGAIDNAAQYARQGGKSSKRLESGLASTSRFGVQVQEDLGDGMYAGIWLESGLKTDIGVAGSTTTQGDQSFFNRQSNVVLGTKQLGEIRLGRQYPAQINPFIDTFAGVTGFSPWASLSSMGKDQGAGASVGDSRISNAVSYSTPDTWALGGMGQVAFRESSTPGAPTLSAYGIEMHYTLDTWYFQAHAMYNNSDPSASIPSFRNGWYGFAVKKELPGVTATYIANLLRPERAGYPNSQTHALSFTIPVGLNTIRISPVYRHVAGTRDLDSFAIGAGYDYNFSKRTALYTRLGYIANRAKATATLGAIPAGDPGDDLSTVAIGVRVRF